MATGQTHVGLFDIAMEDAGLLEKGWIIERMSIKDVREKKVGWEHPKDLVDWLLESSIHIILIQGIHQGMIELWHPRDCQKELLRLEYHPGFPSGNQLSCPVFQANKKHYLLALPTRTNPSFFFPLDLSADRTEEAKLECKMWMRNTANQDVIEGALPRFILKMPYVQNSKFRMKFIENSWDLDSIIHRLQTKSHNCFNKPGLKPAERFPYAIIQPFLRTNAETRVVLFNGVAQYCCSYSTGILGIKTKAEVMEFAQEAWADLMRNANGAFLGDGITRFDVMLNCRGEMKVNEAENLDANFTKLGDKDAESGTRKYIVDYYTAFLKKTLTLVYSD